MENTKLAAMLVVVGFFAAIESAQNYVESLNYSEVQELTKIIDGRDYSQLIVGSFTAPSGANGNTQVKSQPMDIKDDGNPIV